VASQGANPPPWALRPFTWAARHGTTLLAGGIFGGLLIPPLAHVFHWFITPNVIIIMTLVLLRVDVAAALRRLRQPVLLTAITAAQLLAAPLVAAALVRYLPLDPGVRSGVVVFATGCGATSGAAFARLVGLDPELTLLGTLTTTLLLPLTAPPLALSLGGVGLHLGLYGFALRLGLVVLLPLFLSLVLRRLLGEQRLTPLGPAVDGGVVWVLVFYGFAVMDGLTARLLADPLWVAQAALAAFGAAFGLNLLTTLIFLPAGLREAASAGLMSGNRNMAIYLAILPATADPRLGLFFALCQFPLYLSPFLLRPVYRLLLRET
jgi:BASS family bile acid:Na+ symporter